MVPPGTSTMSLTSASSASWMIRAATCRSSGKQDVFANGLAAL